MWRSLALLLLSALCWRAGAQEWLGAIQRGFAAQSSSRWDDAVSAYTSAVQSGAVPAEHQLSVASNLALCLQRAGRLDEALEWFDKVLKAHPENADAHHNRGNVLYQMQRHAEAANAFGRAVQIVPTDAESLFNQGNAWAKMGEHMAAADAFGAVLKLNPRDAHAAYNRANALSAAGKAEDAIAAYRTTVAIDPRYSAAYSNLGLEFSSSGRYSEAAAALRSAIDLEPRDDASYTALGYALKSIPLADAGLGGQEDAAAAFRTALKINPKSSNAYAGLASVLKSSDPEAAAAAFAAAADDEEAVAAATAVTVWLDKLAGEAPTAEFSPASAPAEEPAYPDVFEKAPRCSSIAFADVLAGGSQALLKGGPRLLLNATAGWHASGWDDDALREAVGEQIVDMMVMPTTTHPTLDAANDALVEPARAPVKIADFLRLTGGDICSDSERGASCLVERVPFEAYVAQLNLLRLPQLLSSICLSRALPPEHLTVANLWIGGALMKNGLHFDLYDNLLFQLRGTKRALLFPPEDAQHLYYGPAKIRRHEFDAEQGRISNHTSFDKVRHNVAKINVFAGDVATTHPKVATASPMVCELNAGDALFLPRGWHHAVISSSQELHRNLAVNLWYDTSAATAGARFSSLSEMFQGSGCGDGGMSTTEAQPAVKQEL